MLLLILIGLFTSRTVLGALGIDDYGIYNAVGGAVTVFTFITTAISSAISRFLAFEIGGGDSAKLRRIFCSGVLIQIALSVLIVLLVESVGVWFLREKMNIPPGRETAAFVTLQCSLGVLVVNLLAVPYNAVIVAREKMSAFALISILEATLKLLAALLLYVSVFDKLETYAVLMLAIAVIIRSCYSLYCRRHFEESRGRMVFDRESLREIASFSGWSFLGASAYVFNTQGVNLVVNLFFGVAVNAARGVVAQVENIVRQFVSNFLTALNPQITKTWASGDRRYCFELVRKGSKFSFLTILAFLVPVLFEAEGILGIWLMEVPPSAGLFLRLALIGLLVDLSGNPPLTLILATGKVKGYYLATGLTSYLCLPLVYAAFRLGADATWAYIVFIAIYLLVFAIKMLMVRRATGFPLRKFFLGLGLPLAAVSAVSTAFGWAVHALLTPGLPRIVLVCIAAWGSMAAAAFLLALTPGERAYVTRKVGRRFFPARIAVEDAYFSAFGRRPELDSPQRYTECLQWQKLHDHNPLYHTLADKVAVKDYVAGAVGAEHVIPTIAVYDKVADIDWEALPGQFVIKCAHDSGSTIVCRDKSTFDRTAAAEALSRAQHRKYWLRDREWAYKGIRPRIIVEEYIGENVKDYKFFCFNGVPELLFVASDRGLAGEETKFDFFDMDWRHLDIRNGHPNCATPPSKPEAFEEMKALAARLSRGIPQVRVDFYEAGGKVLFGEFTFYHWSGLVPFDPDEVDFRLGELFNRKRTCR